MKAKECRANSNSVIVQGLIALNSYLLNVHSLLPEKLTTKAPKIATP